MTLSDLLGTRRLWALKSSIPEVKIAATSHAISARGAQSVTREGAMWGYPLSFWQGVVLWTMWGGFVLTAFGAALAVISSFVAYQVSEITQADADRRIADAGETARKANAEVAKANEAAARANERGAALEKEAADARAEQERLKARLAWRRLTQAQHDRIVAALRNVPAKISVTNPNDPEATIFAADFAQTLRDAGWEVHQATTFHVGGVPMGLMLRQTSDRVPHAVALALQSAGLNVVLISGAPEGELELKVGAKPPPF